MDLIKELVFIVGAASITRSDIKNGKSNIPQKDKNKAILTLDDTITLAVNLLKNGFPKDAAEEFKQELLDSMIGLSNESLEKFKDIHIKTAGDNSLIEKNSEIH